MIKYLFFISIYLYFANLSFSQISRTKEYVIFDYFRQEWDSTVFTVGPVYLFFKGDEISFKEPFEYMLVKDADKGKLEIFLKDKLLYEYTLKDGAINGVGYCYYPFLGNIAIQGEFRNNQLNGLVIVMEENGKVLEIMEFKKGIFKKQIFMQGIESKKILKRYSKQRERNPLQDSGVHIR